MSLKIVWSKYIIGVPLTKAFAALATRDTFRFGEEIGMHRSIRRLLFGFALTMSASVQAQHKTALVDCWDETGTKIAKCSIPASTALDRCIVAGSEGLIKDTHGWSVLVESCKEKTDPNYPGYSGMEAEDACANIGRSPWTCKENPVSCEPVVIGGSKWACPRAATSETKTAWATAGQQFADDLTEKMSHEILWCAAGQNGQILAGYITTTNLSDTSFSYIRTDSPLWKTFFSKGFRFSSLFDRHQDMKIDAITASGPIGSSVASLSETDRVYVSYAMNALMRKTNGVGKAELNCIPTSVSKSCPVGQTRVFKSSMGFVCAAPHRKNSR